jgi:hypothetical protein
MVGTAQGRFAHPTQLSHRKRYMDCSAEPVIRRRFAPTAWLAMTAGLHAFSVSKNLTGSPCDAVTTSPCHITRLPRTKVPTGQPVTRTPS